MQERAKAMTEPLTTLQGLCPGIRVKRRERKTVRYALKASVIFSWVDEEGVTRKGRGCTRDISTRGAYVLCSDRPPLGASIILNICIPLLIEENRILRIETEGRVLRVESMGECRGFSIQNDRVATFTNEGLVR
jgi:hypothetical protein